MRKKFKIISKIIFFILIISLLFDYFNEFFNSDEYAETLNIYDEPKNTIETVFLGSSMTEFGIDVMTMYEEYGICAFNMGSSGQPVIPSYYWLEEVYRLQSESLKTVVFDVSIIRTDLQTSFYRAATDNMKLSLMKYNAIRAYANDFNETISYMFPLFSYHSKWSQLSKKEFDVSYELLNTWSRGHSFSTIKYIDRIENGDYKVLEKYPDRETADIELTQEGVEYLDKMIEFCEKNSLELLLIKTPNPETWSSSDHNTFEKLAQEKGLKFLDFNYAPLIDEISYDHLYDTLDGIHLNYYGAKKLAHWLGDYLVKNGYAHDIRGNNAYKFMENDLEEHKRNVEVVVKLRECEDPVEYLTLAKQNKDYTIFITARADVITSLPEGQIQQLNSLGLLNFGEIRVDEYYIAVSNDNNDIYEIHDTQNIEYCLELDSKSIVLLKCGSNMSSCCIDGKEFANNTRGINIIVYDNLRKGVVDTASF